jgi:hypothetical protein
MIAPSIVPGVKKWNKFLREGIAGVSAGGLFQRATNTCKCEIICIGRSLARAWRNVIDVKSGLL